MAGSSAIHQLSIRVLSGSWLAPRRIEAGVAGCEPLQHRQAGAGGKQALPQVVKADGKAIAEGKAVMVIARQVIAQGHKPLDQIHRRQDDRATAVKFQATLAE